LQIRKLIWLAGLALTPAMPAMAQDETPRVEASAGYSYVRANVSASATGVGSASQGFNVNGGSGSIAFNLNRWLRAVADFGGYHTTQTVSNPPVGTATADATFYTYLFGPRLSYREQERWTPFAQALFGGLMEHCLAALAALRCSRIPARTYSLSRSAAVSMSRQPSTWRFG
jgi:hypothetical protein